MEGVEIGKILIKPYILFKYGLLKKILFTEGEQVNKVFLTKKINNLIQDIFTRGLVHRGYVGLETNAQPSDFLSSHPYFTKQEVKVTVVHYHAPRLDVFSSETFSPYIIPEEIRRKLRMWRSYALSTKMVENIYLLSEDNDTKIYREFELKKLKIPFEGQIDMQPKQTYHLKEIRAQWMAVEVGYKRMVSQVDEQHMDGGEDDDFAIDEVGLMNLENMMEG